MKTKNIWSLMALCLVGVLLLSACQILPATQNAAPANPPTLAPTPIPLPESTVVAAAQSPTTAPTQVSPISDTGDRAKEAAKDAAAATVKAYFDALQHQDYQAAADFLSTFSLTVDGMTRGDGADALHHLMQGGMQWAGLQVKDVRSFTSNTILVHVRYQLTAVDPKTNLTSITTADELWPVRSENGKWLYNRGNLIDFHTLAIPSQTMAGLRVKPVKLARYSDHLRLTMMVQNTTNQSIVLGQANEIMAAFIFKDLHIEADKEQLIFGALRSYSETTVDVQGLYTSYPDGVIIRQWKNIKAAPWFTFRFSE